MEGNRGRVLRNEHAITSATTRGTGVIVGLLVAILVIGYTFYSMSEQSRKEVFFSSFGKVTIATAILGYMLSGYAVVRYVLSHVTRKGSTLGCIICSILIAPLSIQIGIVAGTAGGGLGNFLAGQSGIYPGIMVAIALGIVIFECIGALFGVVLGSLIETLLQRYYRRKAS